LVDDLLTGTQTVTDEAVYGGAEPPFKG
jgi:hypothetical protein